MEPKGFFLKNSLAKICCFKGEPVFLFPSLPWVSQGAEPIFLSFLAFLSGEYTA